MSDQNEVKLTTSPTIRKMPLDARIIGWVGAGFAFLFILSGFLYLIGLTDLSFSDTRLVLFGTISLVSETRAGIYFFCLGVVGEVTAYGIIKGHKLGWWLMLICSINNISDSLLSYPLHQITSSTCICIGLGMIAWLFYRRRFYNIGGKPAIS